MEGTALTTPPTPEQLADILDELAVLWPALPAALARDAGTSSGERVTTSTSPLSIPINADVVSCASRLAAAVPIAMARYARLLDMVGLPPATPIPRQLRHLAELHRLLYDRGRSRDAARLAGDAKSWHHELRAALGLERPDRPLRAAHCPLHDDPLTPLVEPGDRGWLRYDALDAHGRPIDPWVRWLRHEVVTCRHCGALWPPGQYLWLGRLLQDADRRRAQTREPGGEAA